MELVKARHRILTVNNPILNTSFSFLSRSNSTCEVAETSYSPGTTLHITVKTPGTSGDPLLYTYGYFSFYTPELEWYKWYWFTAHVDVLSDPRNTMAIALAPSGANANRCTGIISNGIARVKLLMTPKNASAAIDSNKYVEFRCAGKSMNMSDIKFWAI